MKADTPFHASGRQPALDGRRPGIFQLKISTLRLIQGVEEMSKSRATLIHFWPSALLLIVIGCLIAFAWYPYPFLQFNDTAKFPLMMIVIAGLIGPALTGLVYKKDKRGLAFDLSVIIIIQLAAVVWGTMALYQNRPYFMVFTVERFDVLSIRDVDPSTISDPRFLDKPFAGPIMLYANIPTGDAFQKLLKEVMLEGKPDLQYRPEFWSLYHEKQDQVIKPSKPLSELRIMRPESVSEIDKLVQKHGGNISKLNFVPAQHQNGQFAAILGVDSGEIIDTLVVNPWID